MLAIEAKLAGKQREVAGLQDLNTRLFGRFQDMRQQLARTEDKLSHEKLRGVATVAPNRCHNCTLCICSLKLFDVKLCCASTLLMMQVLMITVVTLIFVVLINNSKIARQAVRVILEIVFHVRQALKTII